MTDDKEFRLSRRQALGALGTIGVASAGAGLGTSAFFSDQETFDGNELTAGALDLKVDWEEHYSDWSDDESEGLQHEVKMSAPSDASMWVGLPDPDDPLIWVHIDDLGTFMDNTALEAYPDQYAGDTQNTINNAGGDGIQDSLEYYDACDDLADTPEDLDPNGGKGLRTANADTLNEDGSYKPLVALDDVKPGDFGELTLSFHLCDNPGYVWMNGGLTYANENGHTEPERKDPDEEDGVVELLDEVQTMLWYDEDGDNVLDRGEENPVCVQLVLDASGSMSGDRNEQAIDAAKLLAGEIFDANANNEIGVTYFGLNSADAQVVQSVTTDETAVIDAIESLPAEDGTPIGEGILAADDDFANCSNSDAKRVQIVVTDGENNQGTDPSTAADDVTGTDSDDYTDEIFAVGTGGATESSLASFARPSDDIHTAFADNPTELNQILGQIAKVLTGEEVFYRGTLRELLDALSTGTGIPLDGNRATSYDEVDSNNMPNAGDDPNRDCFVNSTTNAVGLAWWLPVDHANEIQTDGAGFDLGFYTEQCRHNDGAGMGDFVATRTGSGWAKLEENFNGDGSIATSGHARRGETSEELELRNTGDAVVAGPVNHDWPGTAESFSYDHDGSSSATFAIGGDSVSSSSVNPPASPSRIALQTKADEATMTVENVSLEVGGSAVSLSGPTSVEASNSGADRDLQYLVFDTNDLDLTQGFEVTGDITVVDNGSSGNEGFAFDVVVE